MLITGRPKVKNPKNIQIKFLADKELAEDLAFCAKHFGVTKSQVIRAGILFWKSMAENETTGHP